MTPSKQPELFRPIRPDQDDQATRTNCSKVNSFNFLFVYAVNLQVFRDEKTCFYFSKILRDVHHICRRFPTAWLHLATIILFFWLLGWEMGDIWVEKWACQQCWTTNKWCFAKSMLHHFTSFFGLSSINAIFSSIRTPPSHCFQEAVGWIDGWEPHPAVQSIAKIVPLPRRWVHLWWQWLPQRVMDSRWNGFLVIFLVEICRNQGSRGCKARTPGTSTNIFNNKW